MADQPRKGYWDLTPEERGSAPAFAQGPYGPVEFNTATGFEAQAAIVQAAQATGLPVSQLTAEEIAEFRALRAEKQKRDEEAAREAAEAAARLQEPTHFVHLADGTIVTGSPIETHYDNGDGLVAVASVHELRPVLVA